MRNTRLFTGLLILIFFFILYNFQLNNFLIIILLFGIIYDLNYSKIFNLKNSILFLGVSLTVFFFLSEYLSFMILNIFIFISLFLFTLFKSKLTNNYFVLLLFFYLFFSYNLISNNPDIFYFIILVSFINDTIAYISGSYIKGPLIIPSISPKKTWSGTSISFLFSFFIFLYFDYSIFSSLLISISYFLSDIYFSYIKRINKLKDFSNLLPGHGGILDRIDSFVLPIFFAILLLA